MKNNKENEVETTETAEDTTAVKLHNSIPIDQDYKLSS